MDSAAPHEGSMAACGCSCISKTPTTRCAIRCWVWRSKSACWIPLIRCLTTCRSWKEICTRLRWLREQHITGTELSEPTEETLFRVWRPAPVTDKAKRHLLERITIDPTKTGSLTHDGYGQNGVRAILDAFGIKGPHRLS
jgi:hypothetical protein